MPSHSHIFATVTFRPTAMHAYSAVLEATPDGARGKGLIFELQGEGNLPQVSILSPTLHNAKGKPVLLFRKMLLNHSQTLPVRLKNTGTIPATVLVEVKSGGKDFTIAPEDNIVTDVKSPSGPEMSREPSTVITLCSLVLDVNETQECLVVFEPRLITKCLGELSIRIKDNQFEKMAVQLVGEGYEDDVCLENIRGGEHERKEEPNNVAEQVEGRSYTWLYFSARSICT